MSKNNGILDSNISKQKLSKLTQPTNYKQIIFQPNYQNDNIRLHQQQNQAQTIMKKIFNKTKQQQTDPNQIQNEKSIPEVIQNLNNINNKDKFNSKYQIFQQNQELRNCKTQQSDDNPNFFDDEINNNNENRGILSRQTQDEKCFLSQNEISNSQQTDYRIRTSNSQTSSKRKIQKTQQSLVDLQNKNYFISRNASKSNCNNNNNYSNKNNNNNQSKEINNINVNDENELKQNSSKQDQQVVNLPMTPQTEFQKNNKYYLSRQLYNMAEEQTSTQNSEIKQQQQQQLDSFRERQDKLMIIKSEGVKQTYTKTEANFNNNNTNNNVSTTSYAQINGSFNSRNIATAATTKGKETANSLHSSKGIQIMKSPIIDNRQIERNSVLTSSDQKYRKPNFYLRMISQTQENNFLYETNLQKIHFNMHVHKRQSKNNTKDYNDKSKEDIELRQFMLDHQINSQNMPQNSIEKSVQQSLAAAADSNADKKDAKNNKMGNIPNNTLEFQMSLLLDKLKSSWHSKGLQHKQQMQLAQQFIDGPRYTQEFNQKFKNLLSNQNNTNANNNSQNKEKIPSNDNPVQKSNSYKESFERREVHQLQTWFESVMNGISTTQQENYSQFFEQVQCVLSATFTELRRQISGDCKEKGLLLQRVWDMKEEVMKNMLKAHLEEVSVREEEEEQIAKQIEQTIQIQTSELQKKRNQLYKEIEDKLTMNTRLNEQNRYLRKKNKKLEKLKAESHVEQQTLQLELANVRMQCQGLLECIQEMNTNITNLIKQEQLDSQANILEENVLVPANQCINQLKILAGNSSLKSPKLFLGVKQIVEKQFINKGINQIVQEVNHNNSKKSRIISSIENISNNHSPLKSNQQFLDVELQEDNNEDEKKKNSRKNSKKDNRKKKQSVKQHQNMSNNSKNQLSKQSLEKGSQNKAMSEIDEDDGKSIRKKSEQQQQEDQDQEKHSQSSSNYEENSVIENDIWIKNNDEKDNFNFVLDEKSINTSFRFFLDRKDVEIDSNQFVPPVKEPPKTESREVQCTLVKIREKQVRLLKKIGSNVFNNGVEGIEVDQEDSSIYPSEMTFIQVCDALALLRTNTQIALMQQLENGGGGSNSQSQGDQSLNTFQMKMQMLNTMARMEILHQKLINQCEDLQDNKVEQELIVADLQLQIQSLKNNLQDKNQKYEQFCKRFLEDRQKQSKQRDQKNKQQAVSYLLKFGLQNIIQGVTKQIQDSGNNNNNKDNNNNADSDDSTLSLDPLEVNQEGKIIIGDRTRNFDISKQSEENNSVENDEDDENNNNIEQKNKNKKNVNPNNKKKGIMNIIGKKKDNNQKQNQAKTNNNNNKPKPRKSAILNSNSITKTNSNISSVSNNKQNYLQPQQSRNQQIKQYQLNQQNFISPRSNSQVGLISQQQSQFNKSYVQGNNNNISQQQQQTQELSNNRNIEQFEELKQTHNLSMQEPINQNDQENSRPQLKKLKLVDLDDFYQQNLKTSTPLSPNNKNTKFDNNMNEEISTNLNNTNPYFYKLKMAIFQKPKIEINARKRSGLNLERNMKHLDDKQRHLYMQYHESMSYIVETARNLQNYQKTSKNASSVLKTIGSLYSEFFKNIVSINNNNFNNGSNYLKPLSQLMYEIYVHKFGVKNLAEKKIYELLSNVKKADEIPRIFMFGRILNLYKDQPKLSDKEIEFYVRAMALLEQYQCAQSDRAFQNFEKASTNIVQAIEVAKAMMNQHYIEMQFNNKEDQQKIVEGIVKKITMEPNFNIDTVANILLQEFVRVREQIAGNYKQIFFAVKVNNYDADNELENQKAEKLENQQQQQQQQLQQKNNNDNNNSIDNNNNILKKYNIFNNQRKYNSNVKCFINFQEFYILMRNIQQFAISKQQQQQPQQSQLQQQQQFSTFKVQHLNQNSLIQNKNLQLQQKKKIQYDECLEQFYSWSDEYDDDSEEQVMSLKRFMEMCEDLHILQQKDQQDYIDQLQNQQNNFIRGTKVLPKEESISSIQDLESNWNEVKKHLKLKFIKSQTYNTVYQKIIEKLDKSIKKLNKYDQQSVFEAMLLYKLIIDESNHVFIENHLKKLLPSEFSQFQSNYIDVIKTRF